jgi:hypothetical protein
MQMDNKLFKLISIFFELILVFGFGLILVFSLFFIICNECKDNANLKPDLQQQKQNVLIHPIPPPPLLPLP